MNTHEVGELKRIKRGQKYLFYLKMLETVDVRTFKLVRIWVKLMTCRKQDLKFSQKVSLVVSFLHLELKKECMSEEDYLKVGEIALLRMVTPLTGMKKRTPLASQGCINLGEQWTGLADTKEVTGLVHDLPL